MNIQGTHDPIVGLELNNVTGDEAADQERLVALIETELRHIGGGDNGPVW
jgi:hypothetical protein